jgi:hypothetical protein
MKYGVIAAALICGMAASSIAQTQEKQGQDPFKDLKNIEAEEIAVPSDCLCGTLSDAVSGQAISQMLLELQPFSAKFETPHVSVITVRFGKTVKSGRSGLNGDFNLGGAAPGQYALWVRSSPKEVWVHVRVLRRTGKKQCKVRLQLNTSDNSIAAVQQRQ